MIWPEWIDPTARTIAETYAERIFAGDTAAIDEAVAMAVAAREIRDLNESAGRAAAEGTT